MVRKKEEEGEAEGKGEVGYKREFVRIYEHICMFMCPCTQKANYS